MEWTDEAIIISLRRHGESRQIVELLTRDHGRHLGLVRGSSKKYGSDLQPGAGVRAVWRARLEDHLGTYTLEPTKSRAEVIFGDGLGLLGLSSACAVVSASVPEREKHEKVYEAFCVLADNLGDMDLWPALYVRWELGLLAELGFGLELEACAVTGTTEDLTHVSPKTGKAVCALEAEPYGGRLLKLPKFLGRHPGIRVEPLDILDGLKLSGHFLENRLWPLNRGAAPDARNRLVQRMEKLAFKSRISD
jgi:DNA repair protein RecO (recombination protein O)